MSPELAVAQVVTVGIPSIWILWAFAAGIALARLVRGRP